MSFRRRHFWLRTKICTTSDEHEWTTTNCIISFCNDASSSWAIFCVHTASQCVHTLISGPVQPNHRVWSINTKINTFIGWRVCVPVAGDGRCGWCNTTTLHCIAYINIPQAQALTLQQLHSIARPKRTHNKRDTERRRATEQKRRKKDKNNAKQSEWDGPKCSFRYLSPVCCVCVLERALCKCAWGTKIITGLCVLFSMHHLLQHEWNEIASQCTSFSLRISFFFFFFCLLPSSIFILSFWVDDLLLAVFSWTTLRNLWCLSLAASPFSLLLRLTQHT